MSDQLEPETLLREISGLEMRLGELRQAAAMPQADLRTTLDAALEELDLALTVLRTLGSGQHVPNDRITAAEAERRVLRTIFQDAPVPLFLMDRDGGIRRVNHHAAALLGVPSGYIAGKPFTVFCDLSTRAALRSQLAAVVRTGHLRQAGVRFLGKKKPVQAVVTLAPAWIKGEPDPLIVAAATLADGRPPDLDTARRSTAGDNAVATVTHHMDMLANGSELLLNESIFNEAVAIRRFARLLANELGDWVIIDVAHRDGFTRRVVLGPDDERHNEIVQALEAVDPRPGTLPYTVQATRQAVVHAHVEDLELLGVAPDGVAVCALVGATSVLSVPIEDGMRCLGTVTLTSSGENGPFDLLDLGVVQRLGRYLALAIRASRMYRRRSEVADTLQASLLPRKLPSIPGLDLASCYLAATRGVEVGGDFYDVFKTPTGWGFVLGDVCGKGEEAAAVTGTARHGIRLLSRFHEQPAEVLAMVNQVLLNEERFVTAVLVGMEDRAEETVTVATAGHPPAIVIRPDGVVRLTSCGGMPLGLFEDFTAETESIRLRPGDTLLMHSDGVLDLCDLGGTLFGHERLIEVLAANSARPVDEMLIAVERALKEFCHGDLRDDVSILAVRLQKRSLG